MLLVWGQTKSALSRTRLAYQNHLSTFTPSCFYDLHVNHLNDDDDDDQ